MSVRCRISEMYALTAITHGQAPEKPITKTAGSGSQTQERQGQSIMMSRSATGGLGEQDTLLLDLLLKLVYTLPCLSCLQATVDLISS
jgi:hypothetical protein